MKQKTILVLVVFLFSIANIAAADGYYNTTTYDVYNQTWNVDALGNGGESVYSGLTLNADENQSLLKTDWNYFFDSYSEDLICKPKKEMFNKTDFNFQKDIYTGAIPDDETSLVVPLLVFILGSLGLTFSVWILNRRRMLWHRIKRNESVYISY